MNMRIKHFAGYGIGNQERHAPIQSSFGIVLGTISINKEGSNFRRKRGRFER